jgi:hypothetical protein
VRRNARQGRDCPRNCKRRVRSANATEGSLAGKASGRSEKNVGAASQETCRHKLPISRAWGTVERNPAAAADVSTWWMSRQIMQAVVLSGVPYARRQQGSLRAAMNVSCTFPLCFAGRIARQTTLIVVRRGYQCCVFCFTALPVRLWPMFR